MYRKFTTGRHSKNYIGTVHKVHSSAVHISSSPLNNIKSLHLITHISRIYNIISAYILIYEKNNHLRDVTCDLLTLYIYCIWHDKLVIEPSLLRFIPSILYIYIRARIYLYTYSIINIYYIYFTYISRIFRKN